MIRPDCRLEVTFSPMAKAYIWSLVASDPQVPNGIVVVGPFTPRCVITGAQLLELFQALERKAG